MRLQPVVPNRSAVQRYQTPYKPAFAAEPVGASPNPVHSTAFGLGCIYTFLLFSRSSEFIDNHGRMHLVIIFGLLALVALISTGNIMKMIVTPQGKWLTAFSAWIVFGLPFSMWKGGSFANFKDTWIKSYIAFFLIGGLLFTIEHVRKIFFILAVSTCCVIYFAWHAGRTTSDDRLSVTYGTLGNANDLATTLLMGLPFLLFIVTSKKSNLLFRAGFLAASGVLLVFVLKTGSRGGLLGAGVLIMIAFLKSSGTNKIKIMALGAICLVVFPFVVSSDLRARYKTIVSDKLDSATAENAGSAIQSTNARVALLKNAVTLTERHPVFGVGLGQFMVQSANLWIERGETPLWFTSHDIFALVAAETGVLGFVFFTGLIVCCFRTVLRLNRASRIDPQLKDISRMGFTLFIALTAFTFCGIFGTDAYTFQLPLLAAVTAALDRIAAPRIAAAQAAAMARIPVAPTGFVNRRMPPRVVSLSR